MGPNLAYKGSFAKCYAAASPGSDRVDGRQAGRSFMYDHVCKIGANTRFTSIMHFKSREARDFALQSGITEGMSMSCDRMQDVMHSFQRPA